MRFLHPDRDATIELALEDVFLVPSYFDGTSRLDVDLTPRDFPGSSNPLVAANMNSVTGKRMAESMARLGGIGVLPQDMSLDVVERIVDHVRNADPRYDTALSVKPDATVRDVEGIIRKRAHGMVVVVDDASRPIGLVTPTDLRGRDQYSPVRLVMTPDPVTVRVGVSNRDAHRVMQEARLRACPVVNDDGVLVGVLTKEDAVRLELIRPSLDADGRLMVAAAVGINAGSADVAGKLREMGVAAIVLDTAHGHQRRMIEAVQAARSSIGTDVPLVAGNVCTREGTMALIDAGADIIKVNVGPGAMCTTRMQTAMGRPTFSSVLECAQAASERGRWVWADGGVKHPRDVVLYLAAGAARVMVGTLLAGTFESPGDVQRDGDGHLFKESFGMASARAVQDRTAGLDDFERAKKGFFREGISQARIYIPEGRESVGSIVIDMITGVQSAFTYAGATDAGAFATQAVVGVQTPAGYHEGTPHGRLVRRG